MGHKPHKPGSSGWAQVIASLAIIAAATAGTGHGNVPGPRPPTVCVQAWVLALAFAA